MTPEQTRLVNFMVRVKCKDICMNDTQVDIYRRKLSGFMEQVSTFDIDQFEETLCRVSKGPFGDVKEIVMANE